jgi:hypothetical protein
VSGGVRTEAQRLRDAVKRLLLPHIHSRGFQDDIRKLYDPDEYGHLFKRFSRRNGEKLELLNVQFDSRGRARFVFNLGVVPPEGVDYCGYHYAQTAADTGHLPQHARLYAGRPWRMRWFGFPLLKVPLIRNPSVEDIVEHAIRLFPQAEAWLREGVVGPNIRVETGIGPMSAATGSSAGQ